MPLLEGFRVQNYRALRDVALGRTTLNPEARPITPLVAVIGKNGTGKSSLFDAFGFILDSLDKGVEYACDARGRGGFGRLKSMGVEGPIAFELHYRESASATPISWFLKVGPDERGKPVVQSEVLRKYMTPHFGDPRIEYLRLRRGAGMLSWKGEESTGAEEDWLSEPAGADQVLNDPTRLAVSVFGAMPGSAGIQPFHDFLRGWHLSYFNAVSARELPIAGIERHLSASGDNLANVVQHLEREHPDLLQGILTDIAAKIPGIQRIETHITEDQRVLLRFNDGAFLDPFYAPQMSDGTLKMFAYLLLLADPEPPPLLCIEEPENGLYHKLLETLALEFRAHATGKRHASQIFVTTHQPYFVNALTPEEVWVLEKGPDGFSILKHVAEMELVKNLVEEELPLGSLWYSDYLDAR